MKTNEMRVMPGQRPPSIGRPSQRARQSVAIKSGLLGLACAGGVLAILGLLYAIG